MKTFLFRRITAFLIVVPGVLLAADPTPSPPGGKKLADDRYWIIRAEALAVVMPQEKALAWLPELQDESKIAGAFSEILDAIKRKEVTLAGYPLVSVHDGSKGTSETIDEKIYPTQFEPPSEPGDIVPFPTAHLETAFSTAFEKRNVGVTLELNATVRAEGKLIDVTSQVQHVSLREWDTYEATRSKTGTVVTVKQPLFFTAKDFFDATLKNGAYVLVGFHKLIIPEGSVELFILHVSAAAPTN